MKITTIFRSAVLCSLVLLSGCASKTVYQEQTGFLDDYKTLISNNPSDEKMVRLYTGQDLSSLNKVNVKAVTVISGIPLSEQTPEQKTLYTTISAYMTEGLKKEIEGDSSLTLADKTDKDTLDLELAVSAVEVHLSDPSWNQFSRTALGINVVSYGVYLDEAVRILIESRLSTENILQAQSMHTLKDQTIYVQDGSLKFEDVKPALDAWMKEAVKDLKKILKTSAK